MKTKLSTILLVFTTLAINLQAATSALPAALPEFMNHDQLAKWNVEQASATQIVASSQESSAEFYTGKPYVADAGGYVYNYRTYNPEANRWTSADPSGFPDGANNVAYAPVPTSEFDDTGLSIYTTSPQNVSSIIAADITPFATTDVNNISTYASTLVSTLISDSGGLYTYGYWSISSFKLKGSAKGTGSTTFAWGTINVPLTGTYKLPSGLKPSIMSGSVGTPPTVLGNTATSTQTDNINSSGNITVNFSPTLKVLAKVWHGHNIYANISSASMTYTLSGSATITIYLE